MRQQMKLKEVIHRLAQRIGRTNKESDMQLPENFKKLLQMIEHTEEFELPCDDVYMLLDQYTEVVAYGKDAKELMPLVEHHIEICPDCREEFEALLRILEASPTY
jgi:hypothetical protein